ncbi:hypothetical protein F5J12DRAFT_832458 [Pisolithus orientalis]|uniref:uncharacterized protein n=1 Tax=Pisolithus orientalis TaxID=936130 RepID=UPI0022248EBC|nr:uncharacterized protein F5J12DRAFT_832458 [Pisolithus orientalis]KAI6006701.1 hypothetical protein F5J12DRAFT_832458 [Pisolithus orientalis]
MGESEGDFQVECPIHLDFVPLRDILAFSCGHCFCVPCLDAHFASRPTRVSACPACRSTIRRKDAFQLFLTIRSTSQKRTSCPRSTPHPTPVIDLNTSDDEAPLVLISQLKEKNRTLLSEISSLRDDLRRAQLAADSWATLQTSFKDENSRLKRECDWLLEENLRIEGQRESLELRCTQEKEISTRLSIDNDRLKEELAKVKAELQKSLTSKRQAAEETRNERDRVKLFEERCQKFKRQLDLAKKKRKALESENRQLRCPPPDIEDESLVVIDPNQPDRLGPDKPDFAWLEDACAVQGERLEDDDGCASSETEEGSIGGDFPPCPPDTGGKWDTEGGETEIVDDRDRPLPLDRECPPRKPVSRFSSDWSLGPEAEISLGAHRKRKHADTRPVGSKFFKVKHNTRSENVGGSSSHGKPRRTPGGVLPNDWLDPKLPFLVDGRGRVQGTVALGSRQRLNSKN